MPHTTNEQHGVKSRGDTRQPITLQSWCHAIDHRMANTTAATMSCNVWQLADPNHTWTKVCLCVLMWMRVCVCACGCACASFQLKTQRRTAIVEAKLLQCLWIQKDLSIKCTWDHFHFCEVISYFWEKNFGWVILQNWIDSYLFTFVGKTIISSKLKSNMLWSSN